MLTRLKVSGFKNLVDVDVRFGPFTCIAGVNGVGKSNLFDAIRFLSASADNTLSQAALSVRDGDGRGGQIRSLFHRVGDHQDEEISFLAEMIVRDKGIDDLGQVAEPTTTFLRYSLTLRCRKDDYLMSDALEVFKEELVHIKIKEAKDHLLFPHSKTWRDSVIKGRRSGCFISTAVEGGVRVVKLHLDRKGTKRTGVGGGGRPTKFATSTLPRTVLSKAEATGSPTALLARREMQTWRQLQLEPSALRRPDEFSAPASLGVDGSHLPASLYRLGRDELRAMSFEAGNRYQPAVYARVANRLSGLIDDVRDLWVEREEKREILTLHVKGEDRTDHMARDLSDGTLRFLALSVIAEDPEIQGVLCLEEPENGIHPERIPAMIALLRDIAVDSEDAVTEENPLRQVIVNTHSPAVVQQVPEDSLLVAQSRMWISKSGEGFKGVEFACLPKTWRAKEDRRACGKGTLLRYLNPVVRKSPAGSNGDIPRGRVIDREDLQPLLFDAPIESQ